MKLGKCLLIVFGTFIFISCTSTSQVEINDKNITEPIIESFELENIVVEDIDLALSDESNTLVIENIEPEPTKEDLYLESLKNVYFKLLNSPDEINKGKKSSKNYLLQVFQDDKPFKDFPVTIEYPSGRENGTLVFSKIEKFSDENGQIEFGIENTSFAVNSKVLFYPTPIETDNKNVLDKIKEMTVFADLRIKSDLINKGAVLFIWEFNELNKPMGNSYDIISALRESGVWNVGNAPVNEISDLEKSKESLYKENLEIIGNSFGYLICGTIKFTSLVEKVDTEYEANLVADIYVLDMKNGQEIFTTKIYNSAKGTNWNTSVSKCKTELADKIVQELNYGL